MNMYFILIVLYKIDPLKAPTIQSLISCKEVLSGSKVLIWDNSPTPCNWEDLSTIRQQIPLSEVEYLSNPGNSTLSSVYNAVRNRKDIKGYSFVVLFDHDSIFCKDFFREHRIAYDNNKGCNLFLPVVIYKNTVVSPARKYLFRGVYYKKPPLGYIISKNITAINSGMIISTFYYTHDFTGYDKRLNNYGTDDYFMRQYNNNKQGIFVMDYSMQHDLSCCALNTDSNELLMRLKDSNHALIVINSGNIFKLIAIFLYIVMRGLYYSVRYKCARFFTLAINSLIKCGLFYD